MTPGRRTRWRERLLASTLGLTLVLPLGVLLMLSLSRQWLYPAILPQTWQMQQWLQIVHGSSGLVLVTLRSAAIAGTVAIAATVLALPTSRAVARARWRDALLTLAYLPFAVSPVVFGAGLLHGLLRLHLAGTVAGVVFGQFVFAYAYAVILQMSFWTTEAEALADLAATLGASPWQVWWQALVPRARPILAVCLVQTALISWFDYALVLLLGGGLVDTLTLRLFQFFSSGDMRLAATCALLLVAPPLVALLLTQGLAASGAPIGGSDEHD